MLFQVEDRVVDLAQREADLDDRRLEVEPRAFDLLVYLIANRDRLVTKDDLIAGVWRGRIVSDSALASALRTAAVAACSSASCAVSCTRSPWMSACVAPSVAS